MNLRLLALGRTLSRDRIKPSHNRQTVALAIVAVAVLLLIALAGWGAGIEPREAARPLPHANEGGFR